MLRFALSVIEIFTLYSNDLFHYDVASVFRFDNCGLLFSVSLEVSIILSFKGTSTKLWLLNDTL